MLQQHFSSGIRFNELRSIALILESLLNTTKLTREIQRNFYLLIQWFDHNWKLISPVLSHIKLIDSEYFPINNASEFAYLSKIRKIPN